MLPLGATEFAGQETVVAEQFEALDEPAAEVKPLAHETGEAPYPVQYLPGAHMEHAVPLLPEYPGRQEQDAMTVLRVEEEEERRGRRRGEGRGKRERDVSLQIIAQN